MCYIKGRVYHSINELFLVLAGMLNVKRTSTLCEPYQLLATKSIDRSFTINVWNASILRGDCICFEKKMLTKVLQFENIIQK